jgi:RimJ/RimL family protein N-acetyltransferase/ribosomal protein S18 acetylase RimI-like enzyme
VLDRIHDFRLRLQEAVAERRVPSPHGIGLFCDSIPIVYDANYLRVETLAPAVELEAEADRLMERFWHRRVITDAAGDAVAKDFEALGWSQSTHLIMGHVREPDRVVDTTAVREVPFTALERAHARVTLEEPYGDEELSAQLLEAKRRVAAVVPTRFFGAFVGAEVGAYCELRSDGQTAQIEDVNTLLPYRGRGLGRAVVQKALDEARASHTIVFIEALANDWPKELYERLGFDVLDVRHLFLRPPPPLARLRITTPRLVLRLGTTAELRELAEVARQGIHDPAAMPFEVAWTDSAGDPGFIDESIAHHLEALRDWSPDAWRLNLIAFLDGRPVGVQALRADRFAETSEVDTGSWLGLAYQGQGLGTEMRAAVLSLAFDRLGAARAVSGAIQGNPQSLGVSRKLDYEVTGEHMVSPRGMDVPHTDLALDRGRFSSPVPVEIDGLDGLERLFGAQLI